jgi:hypothetical protein
MSLESVLLQWSRHKRSVALNKVGSVRQAGGACQGRLCAVSPARVGWRTPAADDGWAGLGGAATPRMTLLEPALIHCGMEGHVEEDHVVEWH